MAKKIKSFILLFLISSFFLISCEKDFEEDIVNQNQINSNLKVSKINFKEFKNNSELLNKIAKSTGKNKLEQNQRLVHSADNSFYIDTEFAYFVEDDNGHHSYTFQIIRQNPQYLLENLIVNQNDSLGYDLYIAQYNINQIELEKLQNGESQNLINKLTILPISNNTINSNSLFSREGGDGMCLTETVIPGNTCPGPEHHTLGDVLSGAGCPYFSGGGFTLYAQQTIYSWGPCGEESSGGGGGNPIDNGNYDGPGLTGGGVNTTPTYNNTITKPCAEIKKITDKPAFATNMQVLKNNINGTKEKGFVIRDKDGTDAHSQIVEGDDEGNVTYPYADSTPAEIDNLWKSIGTAHNHITTINTQIGIFTPEDLNNLFFNGIIETNDANPYKNTKPVKSVIFVITDKGFFALKINDLTKLQAFCEDYGSWTKDEKKNYLENTFQNPDVYDIRPESSHDNQVIGFLRFIEDQDIGVDLYKGDANNFNNFSKLSIANFGYGEEPYSFISTPCN